MLYVHFYVFVVTFYSKKIPTRLWTILILCVLPNQEQFCVRMLILLPHCQNCLLLDVKQKWSCFSKFRKTNKLCQLELMLASDLKWFPYLVGWLKPTYAGQIWKVQFWKSLLLLVTWNLGLEINASRLEALSSSIYFQMSAELQFSI